MKHLDRTLTKLRSKTEKVGASWGTLSKEKFKVSVFPIKIPTSNKLV